MRHAMNSASYEATVVYWKEGQIDTFSVLNHVGPHMRRERLIALNGPLREIRRENGEITCLFPDARKALAGKKFDANSLLLSVPEKLDAILPFYDLVMGESERVADRAGQWVQVVPRDDMRYRRNFLIDIETRLPLKYELRQATGEVLEQMVVVRLDPQQGVSQSDTEDQPPPLGGSWDVKVRAALPQSAQDQSRLSFQSLPAGFHPMMFMREEMGSPPRQVNHVLLTDGFSSVSVYFDETEVMEKPSVARMGAVNSYRRRAGNGLLTVLGDVPMRTIRAVAKGISIADSAKHE